MRRKNPEIVDDYPLLELMLEDSKQQRVLYNPGPYWRKKTQNSVNEIRRCGLSDFRGSSSLIGLSYADNVFIDYRDSLNIGIRKVIRFATKELFPFNKIFDAQVSWTRAYAEETLLLVQELLSNSSRCHSLLAKYKVPYSLVGGCKGFVDINGQRTAIHYLNLLDQLDRVAAHIDFENVTSLFEIGGGFGTNVHLLIENYNNLRKVLYLDIPPNLYVGTQYLKAFYGKSVCDYRQSRHLEKIAFSDNDQLEIFCIAPWQIERVAASTDIFFNSHSFVEMPESVVENYANCLMRLPNSDKTTIVLMTYDGFDLSTTIDPDRLPLFFSGRRFQKSFHSHLIHSSRRHIHFVSVSQR